MSKQDYLDFNQIGVITLIDFGYEETPIANHQGDVAYDVFAPEDITLLPSETRAIGLGFGLTLQRDMAGLILPRSGLARKGITTHAAPIDSSYLGEIHAIMTNLSFDTYSILKGDRIAQLLVIPVYAPLAWRNKDARDQNNFGSSGR